MDVASENIVYYCLNCYLRFGCSGDENSQCWCSECETYDECLLRRAEHSRFNISHGICRSCYQEITEGRKERKAV